MLGNNIGMPWRGGIVSLDTLQPPVIPDHNDVFEACIAWYDFTDQTTIYKDNSRLTPIGADEHIGRIRNKAEHPAQLGFFMRAQTATTSGGDDGGGEAPIFRLNAGVNDLSYAEFDSNACLVSSTYFTSGGGSNTNCGGGTGGSYGATMYYQGGGLYPNFSANGISTSPNNNTFSISGTTSASPYDIYQFDRSKLTVFWVIKPAAANLIGTTPTTHWLLKPRQYIAGQVGRSQETYFEARTNPSNDDFTVIHRDDDEGASGTSWSVTGGTASTNKTIMMAVFGAGTNGMYLSTDFSSALDSETITAKNFNMKDGLLCLGRWTLGNINSGAVNNTNYEGEFYEILIYNKELDADEIASVVLYLNNKYY